MAVEGNFTAEPVAGTSPLVVQFTDTSTGNPDKWLWEFGDGVTSTEQHPEHTYEGELGDQFTVKLTVWIYSSRTYIGQSPIQGTALTSYKQLTMADGTIWPVWEPMSYNTWSTTYARAAYMIEKYGTSGSDTYLALRNQWDHDTSNDPLKIPLIELTFVETDPFVNRTIVSVKGKIRVGWNDQPWDMWSFNELYSMPAELSGTYSFPMTAKRGVMTNWLIWPEQTNLGDCPEISGSQGFIIKEIHAYYYNVANADDMDIEEKVNYIMIGVPPVANFVASPRSGRNPLHVYFHNRSIPAIGGETTYIWRKRVSGSGAAFQTFSTAVNPVHVFNKDSP